MALGKTGPYPVWSRRAGAASIVGAVTRDPDSGPSRCNSRGPSAPRSLAARGSVRRGHLVVVRGHDRTHLLGGTDDQARAQGARARAARRASLGPSSARRGWSATRPRARAPGPRPTVSPAERVQTAPRKTATA